MVRSALGFGRGDGVGAERYVIRGGVAGRERLRLLSQVHGPFTRALLADVGIQPGWRCLDVGCGGGDVTFELARLVGPTGRAVGVDRDEATLELARREGQEQGLSNVSFEAGDVTGWEPVESFDAVYARFLLTHLADPSGLLAAMGRHVRPGGVVIVEDIDFRGHLAEPDCPALRRYVELYTRSVRAGGGDPNIGPRLPGLLRGVGLEDVQLKLVHPAALQGPIKLIVWATLENIADTVLGDGLISEAELRETTEELRAFVRDPHTVLAGPRVFQAWAWKGGRGGDRA